MSYLRDGIECCDSCGEYAYVCDSRSNKVGVCYQYNSAKTCGCISKEVGTSSEEFNDLMEASKLNPKRLTVNAH